MEVGGLEAGDSGLRQRCRIVRTDGGPSTRMQTRSRCMLESSRPIHSGPEDGIRLE